jgi:hypothetical protein
MTDSWYARNKERHRELVRQGYQRVRAEVIQAYGGACVCCGESTPEFLGIDHIYSDGGDERRKLKLTGATLYRRLRREGFPKDRYHLLCHNCNQAKGYYGVCPHQSGVS